MIKTQSSVHHKRKKKKDLFSFQIIPFPLPSMKQCWIKYCPQSRALPWRASHAVSRGLTGCFKQSILCVPCLNSEITAMEDRLHCCFFCFQVLKCSFLDLSQTCRRMTVELKAQTGHQLQEGLELSSAPQTFFRLSSE